MQIDGAGVGNIARDGGSGSGRQGAGAVNGQAHGVAGCILASASGKRAIQGQLAALVELDHFPVGDGGAIGGGGDPVEVQGVDHAIGHRGVIASVEQLAAVVLGGGDSHCVRAQATQDGSDGRGAGPDDGVIAHAAFDAAGDGRGAGDGDGVIAQAAIDLAANGAGGVHQNGVAHVGCSTVVLALTAAEHIASDGGIAQDADGVGTAGAFNLVHRGGVLHDDGVIGRAAQCIATGAGATSGAGTINAGAAQVPVVHVDSRKIGEP